ncbi:MAG: suppressor of fused domain protein [Bacteroidota bacterium]
MGTEKTYTESLKNHYETYYGVEGNKKNWTIGPAEKLHPDFYVLEIGPNPVHKHMWTYLTVGMSLDRQDDKLIELFIYSPRQSESLVELLTFHASFHRHSEFLGLHHTVNIGQPWLKDSRCDHGFISLPFIEGETLELFEYEGKITHCYWLIPITKEERAYKSQHGCEALEQLFEDQNLDYLNPDRACLLDM